MWHKQRMPWAYAGGDVGMCNKIRHHYCDAARATVLLVICKKNFSFSCGNAHAMGGMDLHQMCGEHLWSAELMGQGSTTTSYPA